MNWEAVGAIGEVLGAFGVVVTLFYLAAQIRQNTKVAKANAHLDIAREWREIWEHADSIYEADQKFRSGDDISPQEDIQARRSYLVRLRNYETQWHYWENGLIDDEQFEAYLNAITTMLGAAPVRDFWNASRTFNPDFRKLIDDRLKELGA